MTMAGFAVAIRIAAVFYRRAAFDGLFLGGALCWAAASVGLLIALPGGSYLTLVPALAFGICALLRSIIDLDETVIAATGCVVAGVLLLPITVSFYDALGRPVLPAIALIVALVTTTVAMVVRRGSTAALVAAAILTIVAIALPPYTAQSPRRLSLHYVDDDGAKTWQADALSPALMNAATFANEPQSIAPWARVPVLTYVAPASNVALQPVELRVMRDEHHGRQRTLVVALHSARGAPRVSLILHAPSLVSLRVNGVAPPPPTPRTRNFFADGWQRVAVRGASDATIELVLRDTTPIDAIAIDTSYGLPPSGAALIAARNASLAVPSDDGDVSTTMRRMRL